ncbi:hypothetical protein PFDG_04534 [Plasmodium falciparum Dd2]|uniref:Uncharacterized protein n=1 Tax=Plasmodium falciparum (isolate Dd2) TaxID=57267 RepID=A0A0L7M5L4_PLAF4|nr:hypothetical protein PFDG_04534 [Plasmodium falciparum Dd2]
MIVIYFHNNSFSNNVFFISMKNRFYYNLIIKRLYTRSGGLRKPQKVTNDPESINRKVYWCFEHKPVKRTIINLIYSHNELKIFSNLLNHPTVAAR